MEQKQFEELPKEILERLSRIEEKIQSKNDDRDLGLYGTMSMRVE